MVPVVNCVVRHLFPVHKLSLPRLQEMYLRQTLILQLDKGTLYHHCLLQLWEQPNDKLPLACHHGEEDNLLPYALEHVHD